MTAIAPPRTTLTRLSAQQSKTWDYLEHCEETKEVLFGGAAGPGKTFLGCTWKIYRRTMYPGTRGLIGREKFSDLRDSTLKTFLEVWDEYGQYNPAKIGGHYNKNEKTFYFTNGSEEIFRHMAYEPQDPNFNRYGSTEFSDLFVDECQEVGERAFDIALSRVRYKLGAFPIDKAKVLACANPEHNWLKWRFVSDKHNKPFKLRKDRRFVQSFLHDNPDKAFARRYDENLAGMSNFDQQRLRFGDWDAINTGGSKFYHAFEMTKHTGKAKYNPALPIHISFDQNVKPYITATLWQVDTPKGPHKYRIYAFDEICLEHPRNNTTSLCEAIKDKYSKYKPVVFIYGDASGNRRNTISATGETDYSIALKILAPFLISTSDRTTRRNPPVLMRREFINQIFEGKFPGIDIFIDEDMSYTISDLLNIKEDKNGKKFKETERDEHTKEKHEKYGHTSDSLDYVVTSIFQTEFLNFIDA